MSDGVRRLGFSSTPCESAAAGLIALGAMLQRLNTRGADDVASHYERLMALMPGKDDAVVLRHRIRQNKIFRISDRDRAGRLWLRNVSGKDPEKYAVLEANAADWIFDGEPPVEALPGEALPFRNLYASLMADQRLPLDQNLQSSDSAVILAGRPVGRTATESLMRELVLSDGPSAGSLSELLAVHGWQPSNVSRVRYFNPRQGEGSRFDRAGAPPLIVVADGAAAYLAARADPHCERASIVTVVPRVADPEMLEALSDNIASLSQWYEDDSKLRYRLPEPPPGVTTAALRVRS